MAVLIQSNSLALNMNTRHPRHATFRRETLRPQVVFGAAVLPMRKELMKMFSNDPVAWRRHEEAEGGEEGENFL